MTARLIFKMAANWNRLAMSDLATSAPTATMATGPERDSLLFSKLVTICCRPARSADPNYAQLATCVDVRGHAIVDMASSIPHAGMQELQRKGKALVAEPTRVLRLPATRVSSV